MADARRANGVLLAFVLVVSQASAWIHAAAISHVTCLEHGETVHGAALPASVTRATVPEDVGQVGLRADLATAGSHDHCGNAALLRWRDVALSVPVTLAPLVAVPRSLTFAPVHVDARGAVIYRLAPKTYPPPAAV